MSPVVALRDREWAVEQCQSCGADIVWALHERTLKPSVVDAAPSAAGSLVLVARSSGPPLYRVLAPVQRFGRRDLRQSHFETCPQAPSWRRRDAA